ncbi:PREDICTED: probable E3 ubiquitin-protein ligase HERC6 [Nanorana parkeri]|uniref:probable E3 ubiquitin-protein ligase HERC6 n=1 Tax=Nanorana parkeri TaxID=125878 RepID=UPI000854096E|nr:PREDICTED: probable E3 ubiquitin-protein ligase HERC6 [Nanorana parkeri]
MYCWGNNRYGQLGLAGQDNEKIHFTENGGFEGGSGVQKVACGEAHTLFLLQDGTVLSCGQNLCGQLGRKIAGSGPEPFHALEAQTIIDMSCGSNYSVAICSEGNIFTWGNGLHGELGSGQMPQQCPIPKRITGFSEIKIIQVACGHYHTIALSEDSSVYSWGKNDVGQLGIGYQTSNHASPQLVKYLRGVPLVQIAAGGSQSFALSMSGMVFGWGKNNVGQLGFRIGSQKGIFKPYAVSSLRNLSVVYISCGDEHTAVLSKDGTVYTFGDDSYGQLGKNVEDNTAEPQKIEEYEGQVSQIACGSYHTLLYVFTSNCIVSFGRGLQAKPETSSSNKSQPPQQPGALDISGLICPKDFVNIHTKRIFAGNYVSFATSSLKPQKHKTTTLIDNLQKICRLDKDMVKVWTDANYGREKNQDAKRQITKIFSSPACLAASFLRPRSSPSDTSTIVDLDTASELFTKLCQCKWIVDMLCSILKTDLIPDIESLPTLYEALSIFLLLPEFPIMYDVNICLPLVAPFAYAVNNLSKNALKMLESMWSLLPENSLKKLIHMFKVSLVISVLMKKEGTRDLLDVLKKLHKVNIKTNYKVPESHFCVPEVSDVIIIPVDLSNWRIWQKQPDTESSSVPEIFCRYPYILTFPTKVNYLHFDGEITKNSVKLQAQQVLVMNRMQGISENPRIPILHLKLRRDHLLEDTLHKLRLVEDCDLRKQLMVEFQGETSADPRAALIEVFLSVGEKMVHPDYGLFSSPDPMLPVWFPNHSIAEKKQYYYYGILCGLAIFNQWVMYLPFPLALFKKLLGRKTTLDDLKELQPTLGRSLQIILDAKDDKVEALELYFTITWENRTIELIPNGTSERVTGINKQNYVNKYVDYIFNTSVAEYFEEFKAGLHKVCDKDILSFFQPDELMDLVAGHANYDWNIFELNTKYVGKYSRDHPTITMFWKVFHDLTLPQKKGFLYFLTGNDKLPVFFFETMCMKISSFGVPKENYLPEAQTCTQLLLLPEYSKLPVLRKKLLRAIENNKGLDRT